MWALRSGSFYASTGPEISSIMVRDDVIHIEVGDTSEILFVGEGGNVLQRVKDSRASYEVRRGDLYVRVEVLGASGTAWSQPFFQHADK